MNVKILRLVSGHDVLTEIEEWKEDKSEIYLKNPLNVILTPQGVIMTDWLPYNNVKTCWINSSHILLEMNPPEDMANEYASQFGGIVVPEKTIIGV